MRLEYYRQRYPEEVFNFCEGLHHWDIDKLYKCLKLQYRRKKNIFVRAREQLGTQSRAQALYDYCLNHHPAHGVKIIGICVESRLLLKSRVENDFLENLIYQSCDDKWARHGWRAVRSCCLSEGGYYRENGELREWITF